uniref:Putative E3 ubiquitin-protein ligase LIN ARM-like domain-containing protein n=1 Tax=Aegilops tauschii subsp. strangulata TaxID=200361 RepID=A0A452YY71_AEGTS
WSNKFARAIIGIGVPFISALAKGLQSKVKGTSHDCLVCAAWLASELASLGENDIRYYACEILLLDIVHHLHPGNELDERVLACMCVYNYTSGKACIMCTYTNPRDWSTWQWSSNCYNIL